MIPMVSLPGISLLFLFFSDSFPFCLIHCMLPHSPFSCLFSPFFLYVLFSLTVLVTVAWERVNGEFHTSFLIFCLEIGHTPGPHTSTDTAEPPGWKGGGKSATPGVRKLEVLAPSVGSCVILEKNHSIYLIFSFILCRREINDA